jgi:transposase
VASDTCALSFTTMRALPPGGSSRHHCCTASTSLGVQAGSRVCLGRRDVTRAANLYWSRKLVLLGRPAADPPRRMSRMDRISEQHDLVIAQGIQSLVVVLDERLLFVFIELAGDDIGLVIFEVEAVKRHVLVDTLGLLLHAIVHPADIQDRDDGILLLATLFGMYPFLQTLFADAGYQGPKFHNALRTILPHLETQIVKRSDQKRFAVLLKRWIVERTLAWLNRCRRLAKDWGAAEGADRLLTETEVTVKTPDGNCDAAFIHPTTGTFPGVLIWPDAFELRPVMRQIARRIASEGYSVLVPNPFYRTAKAPVFDNPSGLNFDNPEDRARLPPLTGPVTAAGAAEKDAIAYVAFLDAQKEVDKAKKIGTQGYCMGGALVVRTAAAAADRIGAGASFHGGGA